ncbi:twisted gastrulation protein homolog 1-A [Scyliorhinus canicula]|uniref:twisted gastrulation protein homolog 1-A n=1 Tax=Scyliorhinus canicula TaxID=7830 RepID=UPI0018F5542B|nr:twisted gastrulation protein homolog 1-A [Scyliorhinus canicula]
MLTILIDIFDKNNIVEGNAVDEVYLDFEEVFNKVPHERLLNKIEVLGIGGSVSNWMNRIGLRREKVMELCQCRPIDGNCSCCKECMLCLGTLWDECCDCVGMCNPRNYSDSPPTSKSTVEELHEPIPSLFRALTEGESHLHWNIVSFPVSEELTYHENLVSFLESFDMSPLQNVSLPEDSPQVQLESEKEPHCTVVYFDDCMSIHQCKNSCESMGASKYRWFHNACCECIGPDCIDYGNKVVKCMNCTF